MKNTLPCFPLFLTCNMFFLTIFPFYFQGRGVGVASSWNNMANIVGPNGVAAHENRSCLW